MARKAGVFGAAYGWPLSRYRSRFYAKTPPHYAVEGYWNAARTRSPRKIHLGHGAPSGIRRRKIIPVLEFGRIREVRRECAKTLRAAGVNGGFRTKSRFTEHCAHIIRRVGTAVSSSYLGKISRIRSISKPMPRQSRPRRKKKQQYLNPGRARPGGGILIGNFRALNGAYIDIRRNRTGPLEAARNKKNIGEITRLADTGPTGGETYRIFTSRFLSGAPP